VSERSPGPARVGALDRLKGNAVVGAFRAGTSLAAAVPTPVGRQMSSMLGSVAAFQGGDRRTIVERNLRRVYGPKLRGPALRRKVHATFESYARYYYDSFRLSSMDVADVAAGFSVEGIEHLDRAMADDPVGPVLALPHLGGWEWAGYWITQVRHWGLAAVVEEIEPKELFEWFLEFRRGLGMNMIPLGPTAAADVATAAANHEIVCLLCDRDIVGGGVPVEFFGEQTTLPAGPAVMALKGGCTVLPTAVYFRDEGVHGVIRPPVVIERDPDAASIRGDVAVFTQALARELEWLIRRAPEEWHLMQPNWPSDVAALDRAGRH
jgi:KDO2-lipid IV(A) lauroyltransferase